MQQQSDADINTVANAKQKVMSSDVRTHRFGNSGRERLFLWLGGEEGLVR